jgi:adenine-specific DNA glycosylase
MIETLNQPADFYEHACDSCPLRNECQAYQEAFGSDECLRDDYGKALMDYLKDSREVEK